MRSDLRSVRILDRAAGRDRTVIGRAVSPDLLEHGDTFECIDRPVFEVDPVTRQATDRLKRFVAFYGPEVKA